MSFIRLLDGLQDSPVYPEGHGDGEQSQRGIGQNADDAAAGEGEEDEEAGAEDQRARPHVPPVQQIQH